MPLWQGHLRRMLVRTDQGSAHGHPPNDPAAMQVQDANTIILRWRLEGALKVGLPIKAYTGTTMYNLDEATGLVKRHYETWDISAVDCFVSCFFPSFGAPPALPVEQLRAREAAAA